MVNELLDTALIIGLSELDFWDMTIAEVSRAITAYNKRRHIEEQQHAAYDYKLASLLTSNISVLLTGKGSMPTLYEAYPDIFEDIIESQREEMEQKKKELSVLRFKQFAQSYNDRFNRGGAKS